MNFLKYFCIFCVIFHYFFLFSLLILSDISKNIILSDIEIYFYKYCLTYFFWGLYFFMFCQTFSYWYLSDTFFHNFIYILFYFFRVFVVFVSDIFIDFFLSDKLFSIILLFLSDIFINYILSDKYIFIKYIFFSINVWLFNICLTNSPYYLGNLRNIEYLSFLMEIFTMNIKYSFLSGILSKLIKYLGIVILYTHDSVLSG